MKYPYINKESGALFFLTDFKDPSYKKLFSNSAMYKIVFSWNSESTIFINNKVKVLKRNEFLFCKPLCNIEVIDSSQGIVAIAFNKDFYNPQNRNEEMLFYWFWYFGIRHPLTVMASTQEINRFKSIVNNSHRNLENKRVLDEYGVRKKMRFLLISISQKLELEDKFPLLKSEQLKAIKKFSQLIEGYFDKPVNSGDSLPNNYLTKIKTIFSEVLHGAKQTTLANKVLIQKKY